MPAAAAAGFPSSPERRSARFKAQAMTARWVRSSNDTACGQLDIGNAETEGTARMHDRLPQAWAGIAPEPTMDV